MKTCKEAFDVDFSNGITSIVPETIKENRLWWGDIAHVIVKLSEALQYIPSPVEKCKIYTWIYEASYSNHSGYAVFCADKVFAKRVADRLDKKIKKVGNYIGAGKPVVEQDDKFFVETAAHGIGD